MTRTPRALLLVTLALVAASSSSPAFAQQPPAPDTEATKLYADGRKLLEQGKFPEAVAALEASMKALPSPNTELLVAHAQRQAGRRTDAMETYNRVVATAGARVREGEKRFQPTLEEAGRWIAVLRGDLGEVVIMVRDAPKGATLDVAGAVVPTTGEGGMLSARAWSEPGDALVTARAPDGKTASRKVTVAAGGSVQVDLDVGHASPAAPAVPIGPVPPEAPPAAASSGFKLPPVPILAAGGVGVVGLGVFAIFGAMSASASGDLDACSPSCPESLREDAETGRSQQTVANVGLIVGSAGLAAATVLWFVLPRSDAVVAITPGRVGVTGRF